jgi:two-component system OmpR family response regulator
MTMTTTKEGMPRILIVDDSELILNRASAALTGAGYEVTTTMQTIGASRYLGNVDLVILDFHMPGIDGGDLVGSMRKACERGNARCLFYLNTSDEEVARDFKRLGFDGAFTAKGNERALVQQVGAVARLLKMRGIAARVNGALKS